MIDPEQCEEKEWIIPTRTGGYSSSTICGINSRTYHGYLIVPLNPPHSRHLILSKFEDFLILNGKELPLSTNRYNFKVYYPNGYLFLNKFILGENFVSWQYLFDNSKVNKTLIVNKGTNSITVTYDAYNGYFKICPLITFRSHHVALKSRPGFFEYSRSGNTISIKYNGNRILNFYIEGDFSIENTEYWYYNFFYKLDYERGSNSLEDLYNPFCIISKNNTISITAYYDSYKKSNIIHLQKDILQLLSIASLDFVTKNKDSWSIIAGYHWFDEWGRDTFISLEGLLLANGQYDIAKNIINRYLQYENEGLLPNNFLNNGEPIYKGVDVSLWAINAIYKYYLYTRDLSFIKDIFPRLLDIVDWYWKGNSIIKNDNGILFHYGSPRTWMDAEFDSQVVTPREGAAVEINALWYNSLMIMDYFSNLLEMNTTEFKDKAEKVKESFNNKFVIDWGLYDFIDLNYKPDTSIRPNQIFAVSLPFSVVDKEVAKKILNTIENELLRPYGLSTLSKEDKNYIPYYRGDRKSRDMAYHNGPIWPWLIGAYIDSKIKLSNDIIEIKSLINYLEPLITVAKTNNGYVPELFEDIPPYNARGCIAQAWSTAELLRSLKNILSL
ncbi:glycogen debranching protein [Acidianus sulfidivorans JP7]|uniref:Glycogen debranching protein n=1 Tax=Acidianus sulfidivorans JP7 TaxID=619593 RepID=A0A2U9IKM1_9CREN|nr:amylo-alpha-1,6-glucosidase [Acidianus sulfidivorans]AWR96571.1 glycogen debranching protein [Acidianus sulfidivorans JP7]